MAFNPFESFRKNGKGIMAVLAIVCMFTFVLSAGIGGGNDFFDWAARQFGGEDRRGGDLGEVDGRVFHSKDLNEIRSKRMAANNYMLAAVDIADNKMLEQIDQDLKNNTLKDKEAAKLLQSAVSDRQTFEIVRSMRNEQILQQFAQRYEQSLQRLRRVFETLNTTDHPTEYRAIRRFFLVLGNQGRQRQRQSSGQSNLYFDQPNTNERDALQFEAYLRSADKMGIKLSESDIESLISKETDGLLVEEDFKKINGFVRKNRSGGLSPDQLLQAIGDEFRVQAAMSVLRGTSIGGRITLPAAMTPYEFYEFYKDRCAELAFDVVDVPVDMFVSQVKEEPPEAELRALFDKYRKDEYDPSRPTPGFKEPRKARVEYVGLDAEMAPYKKGQPALLAASTIAAGLSAATSGDSISGAMFVVSPPLAESWLAEDRAAPFKAVTVFDMFRLVHHGLPFVPSVNPNDSSFYHPLPNAALAAQLAVLRNPIADLSAAVAGYRNLADLIETRDRVKVGMQMTVAPMGFNPIFPLTAIAAIAANAPKTPEGIFYAQELDRQRRVERPQRLARADLENLNAKLLEIHKKTQPKEDPTDPLTPPKKIEPSKIDAKLVAEANKEAGELVKKWIAERPGVLHGESKKVEDKFSMLTDPDLKALTELVLDKPQPYRLFAYMFLSDRGREPSKESSEASLYNPIFFPEFAAPAPSSFDKPAFLAWTVEDLSAKTYANFDAISQEMRANLVRAWKVEKARVLAKTAAEQLAAGIGSLARKELRDANNPSAFNKGLADKVAADHYTLLTDRIRLAKLSEQRAQQMNQPNSYGPTRLTNKQIPYPLNPTRDNPVGMADLLLEERNKPLGEVVVTPDLPGSHFYVCVLVEKKVPNTVEFNNEVFRKTNPTPRTSADSLYSEVAQGEAVREYMKDALSRFKAEMKYKETDEMKKSAEKATDPNE